MSTRDSRWTTDIEIILCEEKKLFEEEQILEIESMYVNYHKKHVSGITYEEWLKKSRKLYTVNGAYTVFSIANGPDNQREWQCRTLKQAHKRILTLIYYKQYDHFVRGHDFAYDPDDGN
jgi:hypothetical protein